MREIYYPSNRVAADLVRLLLPSDIARRRVDVAVLRTLDEIDKWEAVDDEPVER